MDWLIKKKAEELADGVQSKREKSQRVAEFVSDRILYSLDEWNVQPDEVFQQGSFSAARFGRHIVMRNQRSQEEQE